MWDRGLRGLDTARGGFVKFVERRLCNRVFATLKDFRERFSGNWSFERGLELPKLPHESTPGYSPDAPWGSRDKVCFSAKFRVPFIRNKLRSFNKLSYESDWRFWPLDFQSHSDCRFWPLDFESNCFLIRKVGGPCTLPWKSGRAMHPWPPPVPAPLLYMLFQIFEKLYRRLFHKRAYLDFRQIWVMIAIMLLLVPVITSEINRYSISLLHNAYKGNWIFVNL